MAAKPSEILRKTKPKDADDDAAKKGDDKDKKKPRRSALIDFIAKHKNPEK